MKLDQITNDLLPDLVIVLWSSNFKSIPSLEEHRCRHNCCSFTSRHKNRVVEIVVVHFVQMSFFNALQRISIQSVQIVLKNIWKASVFQLLMIFRTSDDVRFWWTASEEVLLMTSASLELLVFRTSFLQHKLPSCWFHCYHLFLQNLYLIQSIEKFCLWSCTLEQILEYPIDTFNTLLSSKLKGYV